MSTCLSCSTSYSVVAAEAEGLPPSLISPEFMPVFSSASILSNSNSMEGFFYIVVQVLLLNIFVFYASYSFLERKKKQFGENNSSISGGSGSVNWVI